METAHSVRHLTFEVGFGAETAALEAQGGLRQFASGRLPLVLDEVLSRYDRLEGGVLRIGRLDIDLGRLSAGSYYEECERRLRERLGEAIGRALAEAASLGEAGPKPSRILARAENELEILAGFLDTGELPWSLRDASRARLDEMLRRVIADSSTLLAARLRSWRTPAAAAKRLEAQFPADLVDEFWNAAEPSRVEADHGPERLLRRAVVTGERDRIAPAWVALVATRPYLIEDVVRRFGARAEVRRRMARGFTDTMLRDIAGIIEPAEIGFVEEVVGRPEIFKEAIAEAAATAPIPEGAAAVKSHLWEFTLTYLLVERGGNLNRSAYLASALRQMAAHENLSYRSLVGSLCAALDRIEVHSRVREEMLRLVSRLNLEAAKQDQPEPADDRSDTTERHLAMALLGGDPRPLHRCWQRIVRDEPETVERVVRRLGAHATVRYWMARRFPEPVRRDIVRILEPSEAGFLGEIVGWPERFRKAAEQCGGETGQLSVVRSRLWELTFTWLLAERGSRFNRRAYLSALIRGMAAHDHLDPDELLAAWAETLERAQVSNALRAEIRSLAGELPRGESVAPVDAIESWEAVLENALTSGDPRPLSDRWGAFLRGDPKTVATIVRRRGHHAAVRRAMARGFSEAMLLDIAALLWPAGIESVREVTRAAGRVGAESATTAWEFTLAYLLSGRAILSKQAYAALALAKGVSSPAVFETAPADDPEAARFQAALLSGNPDGIAPRWREYARRDGRAARQILRRVVSEPRARASIAAAFPEPLLLEMVWLLDPRAARFVSRLVQGASDEASRRALLEASLAYLVEWGGMVSKDAFAAAVRDAARRDGVLRGSSADDARSEEAIRSCELYDIVAGCLLRGAAPPAEGLDRIIDELMRRFPEQVARLLREWNAGAGEAVVDLPLDAAAIGRDRSRYRLLLKRLLRRRASGGARTAKEKECLPAKQITAALTRVASLGSGDRARLVAALDRFADQPSEEFLDALRRRASGPALWAGLAAVLPERQLARLLGRMAGTGWERLLRSANSIVQSALARGAGSPAALQKIKWRFLFDYLAKPGGSVSEREFNRRLHARLEGRTRPAEGARRTVREENAVREDIHVANAGQVLLAPYLPRLFETVGLLQDKVFPDAECAARGAHLLEYAVAEAVDPPEHRLVLNKILCGLEPADPVERVMELRQSEKDTVDALLQAVIAHWGKLGNTSVRGLRESFLQREGRLRLRDNSWRLLVAPRAFDMLLDGLPWSYSIIRHPWMKQSLYVEWR